MSKAAIFCEFKIAQDFHRDTLMTLCGHHDCSTIRNLYTSIQELKENTDLDILWLSQGKIRPTGLILTNDTLKYRLGPCASTQWGSTFIHLSMAWVQRRNRNGLLGLNSAHALSIFAENCIRFEYFSKLSYFFISPVSFTLIMAGVAAQRPLVVNIGCEGKLK